MYPVPFIDCPNLFEYDNDSGNLDRTNANPSKIIKTLYAVGVFVPVSLKRDHVNFLTGRYR